MSPITHAKVSTKADSPDTSLVRPSDWNEDHAGDWPAADVVNIPAGGIAATDVQAAINELDTEKAAIAQEAWHLIGAGGEPAFQNAWVNFGGAYETAGFFKDTLGRVHLKGLVKDGVIGAAIFTLPAGYRPPLSQLFAVPSNDAYGHIRITGAGVVEAPVGDNTWVAIDGISFSVA